MSLSGWRPAVTLSRSSWNREPAFGPRLTTSRADPDDSPSTPRTSSLVSGSADPNRPPAKIEVESDAADPRSLSVTRHSFISPWHCTRTVIPPSECARLRVRQTGSGVDEPPRASPVGTTVPCRSRLVHRGRGRIDRELQVDGRLTASALADRVRIPGRVEQFVDLSGVGELDLDHPAVAVRIGVDQLGC